MNRRFSQRLAGRRSSEQGFTLLELLVCIVILSILAATASQHYLHQRRKGWEAQVRASLRHMAGAENNFMYGEGAPSYTRDLDDLHLVGYRWSERSVRPYVALATRETFCIQVHSAYDPSIVWHFSSAVGRPQRGPATPSDCGDPEVLGIYIAGLPSASEGRDGRLSILGDGTSTASNPGTSTSARDGDTSGIAGGSGSDGSTSHTSTGATNGSTPGFGTTDATSGTSPTETAGPDSGSTGTSSGCTDDGTGSGSTTGTNHPSKKDRDTEDGGSGSQGSSDSDPDGDENDGADKPGEDGGANTGDQDGNNGSGNDTDFEDDNKGPDRDGSHTPGTSC